LRQVVKGDLEMVVTPELLRAEEIIASAGGVLEVQAYGDRLHVFVDDAARRMPELQAALSNAQIPVGQIRPAIPHLEDAFISLIQHQPPEH
ncbi:MAG TPA: ABC transporter ATP-binding protein, partial [Anaerolineae bacterium]